MTTYSITTAELEVILAKHLKLNGQVEIVGLSAYQGTGTYDYQETPVNLTRVEFTVR
jgi:hypothetical protein